GLVNVRDQKLPAGLLQPVDPPKSQEQAEEAVGALRLVPLPHEPPDLGPPDQVHVLSNSMHHGQPVERYSGLSQFRTNKFTARAIALTKHEPLEAHGVLSTIKSTVDGFRSKPPSALADAPLSACASVL
ncbi:hypothetical protein FOZ63_021888, partial [Perkinsus olseni]